MGESVERGVLFPAVDGRRSTGATAREVFAEAARAADPALAAAIATESDWRRHYIGHLRRLTAVSAADPTAARAVAGAGLAALHDRFTFRRGGDEVPLPDAFALAGEPLRTTTVTGSGAHPRMLEIPYRGELLTGDALHRRLDAWVAAGVVEPSCAEALRRLVADPDWLDLSDLRFALLGAAAEMGPLRALCRWGAEVLAVDVRNPAVTARLLSAATEGSGRVHLPVRGQPGAAPADPSADAGADLLTELPEVRRLLDTVEGPLVLGNYVYADGSTFVRLAMAVDALAADLARDRPGLALAYLATPTDVFAVPEECVADARARVTARPTAARALLAGVRRASGGHAFVPHYRETVRTADGRLLGLADSLVVQQGPNYALAKRLQRWRAALAPDAGVLTSANVAPATRTRSVVRNRVLSAAYAGAHRFGVEVFEPATSSALMAALLVHDLRNPAAPARPGGAPRDPEELLTHAAAHGGLWRVAWEPRSVLGLAALTGFAGSRRGGR